ncbi:TRAP transporter small permease [Vibrio diazotrophicus]|uniref:TRAP transporter small permease protein n=1 Tax=Vibrio diazotrophicus TaxID=685 RepID=A0ABX4WF57_VIBDI|nr:TRAP transporter small permease [Vibrio diazotrophicus]PNI03485.1 TRAP transporter small permease [Vibrio diazotrophicus]
MKIIRKWLDRTIEVFACVVMTMMVLVACWQVISRYVFNDPSTFSEELLRFSLVWLSVIGLAYVAGKTEHIALTLFLDKFPKNLVKYWNMLIQVVFIFFAIYIMIIGGWKVSSNAMMQVSPVLQLSMGKVYYALPLSGVLIIVYSVMNIVDLFKAQPVKASDNEKGSLVGDKQYD